MFVLKMTLISTLVAVTGNVVLAADAPVAPQPLLSCKFGTECQRENADCDAYDDWIIVRYYEDDGYYALYNALESIEEEVLVREMGAMTLFENETIGDGETGFGSSVRMAVGPTLESTVQGAEVFRSETGELTFSSFAHSGMCRVIE